MPFYAFRTTTFSAGVRVCLPSFTAVNIASEHQWRSDGTAVDRVLVGMVQAFR